MALVRLSDVVIPEVYSSYETVDDPQRTAFFESGIVVQNAMLDKYASSGGHSFNLPFWNDINANLEPNISNDNPTDSAVPNKVTTGRQTGRNWYINQWFSAADLAGELAGSDPMSHIRARFSTYWQRVYQRRLIAMTLGILADNIANDGGDMVSDVSVDDGAAITSAQMFSRTAFTGSAFTLGDMVGGLSGIVVHSMVYKRMIDNDDIDFIKPSTGDMQIPTFMGMRVVVDDSMPVTPVATGTGFKYTSVLFGPGAFGYGNGSPTTPVEVERKPLEGNGGGVEIVGERKTWLLHPAGFALGDAPAADGGYTNAELGAAATWDRVVERKNVPVAFLVTNG